jgi:hypothetical protein
MRRTFIKKLRETAGNLLFAVLLGGWGLSACTYHTNDYDLSEAPDGVSFESDIIPIFETSCNAAGCHNGTIPPDLRANAAYVNLLGLKYVVPGTPAEENKLVQVIDGGSMTVYATDLQRSYIKKWIDEGAQNN